MARHIPTDFNPALLDDYNRAFETATPEAILEQGLAWFDKRLAVLTSFQPTGIVTLHLLTQIAPNIPVLTIDTGRLFPETYALIDQLEQRLHLNLIRVRTVLSLREQAELYGDDLYKTDPDQCCHLRKVQPAGVALSHYDAWIAGLRRDQSGRSGTPFIGWDTQYSKWKFAPLANWTRTQVWSYIHSHSLPYNPLHDRGYASIGCNTSTCTQPIHPGEDERAGRWVNHDKTECGLHVAPSPDSPPTAFTPEAESPAGFRLAGQRLLLLMPPHRAG